MHMCVCFSLGGKLHIVSIMSTDHVIEQPTDTQSSSSPASLQHYSFPPWSLLEKEMKTRALSPSFPLSPPSHLLSPSIAIEPRSPLPALKENIQTSVLVTSVLMAHITSVSVVDMSRREGKTPSAEGVTVHEYEHALSLSSISGMRGTGRDRQREGERT